MNRIFRVLQTYPLKMNLILEIRMVGKDRDTQISDPPLFPMLPHSRNVCSTELYTFL